MPKSFQICVSSPSDKCPEVEFLGPSLSHLLAFVLTSVLCGINIATPTFFLLISIFMKYLFSSLCFQSVCVCDLFFFLNKITNLRDLNPNPAATEEELGKYFRHNSQLIDASPTE